MAEYIAEQTVTVTEPLTVDAYMALYSAERPLEVVNGEIIEMSPPGLRHSRTSRVVFNALEDYVEEHQTGEAFFETTFILDAEPRTDWVRGSRVPDVSYVLQNRIDAHLEKYNDVGPLRLAPDLAVEIVSPNDDLDDVQAKVAEYLGYGVRLVWVIDPQARTIRVHTLDSPDGHMLHDGDTISGAPVLSDWSMPVKDVFGEAE